MTETDPNVLYVKTAEVAVTAKMVGEVMANGSPCHVAAILRAVLAEVAQYGELRMTSKLSAVGRHFTPEERQAVKDLARKVIVAMSDHVETAAGIGTVWIRKS